MRKVSVIGTVHNKNGLANSQNLLKILESVQPEVIFLEVTPADFDKYYTSGILANLESAAVIQYRKSNNVHLVPVDCPIIDKDLKKKADWLKDAIYSSSMTKEIETHILMRVSEFGFLYLNSDKYSEDKAFADENESKTIMIINNPQITEIHEWWNTMHSHREDEMVCRIHEYARSNTFRSAVFLIGSAHRDAIIKKSKERNDNMLQLVNWQYHGD